MKILVAEGDSNRLSQLSRILQEELSAEVIGVSSVTSCLGKLQENGYDGVILDYRLPGMSVPNVLNDIRKGNEDGALIVLLNQSDEKMVRDCMMSGADDHVIRTLEYLAILPVVVTRALEKRALLKRELILRRELLKQSKFSAIGRVVTGIGHNMNSPLASVIGRIQLFIQREEKERGELMAKKDTLPAEEFERQMKRYEKNLRDMTSISESAARLVLIVKNMTNKGHHEQNEAVQYLNLTDLLREELNFLDADMFFKHDVIKRYEFAESLPFIRGVYSDFSQSLMAVVHNVLDALRSAEKKELFVSTNGNGQSITVTIHHTGCYLNEREITMLHNLPSLPGVNDNSALDLLKPYKAQISCTIQPGDTTVTIEIPCIREKK